MTQKYILHGQKGIVSEWKLQIALFSDPKANPLWKEQWPLDAVDTEGLSLLEDEELRDLVLRSVLLHIAQELS